MSESVFDMSEMLESINGGVDRYDMQQVVPTSGNVNQAVIGQGQASSIATFQWQDGPNWWSPCQSYFSLILQFKHEGGVPTAAKPLTYADNFVMTLFTQINSYINSRPLDTVNTPWLIDTALTYSGAKKNFLDTWGSLTRVGEPLSTRLRNIQSNNGVIEVIFRPCLSIFDVKLLPPGAQFKLDFNWAGNGINAIESLYKSVSWNTDFTSLTLDSVSIQVQSFTFFKATVHPGIPTPPRGIIDLMPCQALQYISNGGQVLKQNITMPPTTNRILVVFQDISSTTVTTTPPVDLTAGVGNGYNPATSFSTVFIKNAGALAVNNTFATNTTGLNQLWLSLPELAINEPSPVYTFNDIKDYARAYSDFCHVTQGTHHQSEGSIPFGYSTVGAGSPAGVTIIHLDTNAAAGNFAQIGDINNPQQYSLIEASTPAPAANSYNQTSRWGWLGRCPGPIFAFPVVRPEGRTISTGTLNVQFTTSVASVAATIISSYSMAIALEAQANGLYSYMLIDGV